MSDTDYTEDELDELAGKLIVAITAVVDFGRAAHRDDLFHAASVKALLYAQAALIVQTTEPSTDEAVLTSQADALRAAVADYRRDG